MKVLKQNIQHVRKNKTGLACLFSAFFLLMFFGSSFAENPDGQNGIEWFRKGKKDLDAGRYSEAVNNLTIARKEFPLLDDYALYYISESHHNAGEHGKSTEAIRLLLSLYPDSTLRKKARMTEIREAGENSEEELTKLLQSYVKDYPDDEENFFAYGQALKNSGEKIKAAAVFRQIYIKAGRYSAEALSEFGAENITTTDILERASNLIKLLDFADAEKELRRALAKNGSKHRTEILKNLAVTLFKQKKYHEAAEIYEQVNDIFFNARSLYRAGDRKGFELSLNALITKKDKKAGFLLLAVAGDKRRDKDYENALQLYKDILNNYPSDAEDALWGKGWTEYISGDYKNSLATFSLLYEKYAENKYLYWQAKSLEASGSDATELYKKIAASDNNFYAAITDLRNGLAPAKPALQILPNIESPANKARIYQRVDALIALNLLGEAAIELTASCKNMTSPSELIYSTLKFQEMGEFKRSISLALKLPYSDKTHQLWYPYAYRDKVEQAASKYGIDPYIILSIIREESRFDQFAKSPAGAYGLMQLMPNTAYRLDKNLHLGISRPSQLTDAGSNIFLGTYYLKSLFEEFPSLAHVVAAYNAGEAAVRGWQKKGNYKAFDEFIEDIPYNETRNYVKRVITSYFQYKRVSVQDTDAGKTWRLISGKI